MKSWVDDEQVTFLSLPFKAATAVNFQSETLKWNAGFASKHIWKVPAQPLKLQVEFGREYSIYDHE